MKTVSKGQVDIVHDILTARRTFATRAGARGHRRGRRRSRLLKEIEKNALIGQGMELVALLFVIGIAMSSENAENAVDQVNPRPVVVRIRGVRGEQREKARQRIDALVTTSVVRLLTRC